jgi:tetratricopeptide (TPR) repeat protein
MTTNQPLSLFISSKMGELAEERRAVQTALKAYQMSGWLWEDDAGARPETIRSTYLKEVEACDLYLGLFWLEYSPYTIEEYQHARKHQKPCLVYEKRVKLEQRNPELAAFLQEIGRVENLVGLTIRRFQTAEELAKYVQEDVLRLLTTDFRKSRQQPPAQQVWNVPDLRNPFFTGRETLLTDLHTRLSTSKAAVLTQAQAISGLGGIGKTQTAVEYAYRYRDEYHVVHWIVAATRDTLITSFLDLARLLNLPEKDVPDQKITMQAVKRWLEQHDQWLLIFDNADDLALTEDFLPKGGKGHILLTTRAQALGTLADGIDIEKMDTEEGMLLLLHRAKVLARDAPLALAPAADRAAAESIVKEMDGLPLALDQAGAYIEETRCSVSDYLNFYRQHQGELLERRGGTGKEYPETVATTWSLSFKNVERANEAAAELLRFLAFLAPDAIPGELLTKSAAELGSKLELVVGDQYRLDITISALLKYSLVHRDSETNTLSIHRLVQEVLKDQMNMKTQRLWAERTVRAVNGIFPEVDVIKVDVNTLLCCERYLPHAQNCEKLIDHHKLVFLEAGRLLYETGHYLRARAQNAQAEPLFQKALKIREQVPGARGADTASTLNDLAWLYLDQGRYKEAEPLYQRAFNIRKRVLGTKNPDTAYSLQCLARLYSNQGQYEQAEPLLKDALEIRDQVSGAEDANAASILHYLAWFYRDIRQDAQAEPLFRRALAIRERELGVNDRNTASTLHDLAWLSQDQGKYNKDQHKYQEAELLYQRALAIRERVLGAEHPDTASTLHDLALLYQDQGKYEQAEPLYQRAQAIREQQLGPEHPNTTTVREN